MTLPELRPGVCLRPTAWGTRWRLDAWEVAGTGDCEFLAPQLCCCQAERAWTGRWSAVHHRVLPRKVACGVYKPPPAWGLGQTLVTEGAATPPSSSPTETDFGRAL